MMRGRGLARSMGASAARLWAAAIVLRGTTTCASRHVMKTANWWTRGKIQAHESIDINACGTNRVATNLIDAVFCVKVGIRCMLLMGCGPSPCDPASEAEASRGVVIQ